MLKRILLITLMSLFLPTAFAADEAPTTPANKVSKKDIKLPKIPMSTTAFLDQGALPVLYTCDGKDISPQLGWEKLPQGTKSLVLLLQDVSIKDKSFYHWVAFNIPSTTKQLDQGASKLPNGTKLGSNSMDKASYNGPCPPKGSAHTYAFDLFALNNTLNLPASATGEQVLKAIQGHIIGKGKLSTVYSRWLK